MSDEMGFETLFEVLMREKNREELQRLDADFFDEALTFIEHEQNMVDPSNHVGFQRVRNLRSMVRELYSRREHKIVRLAMMSARGSTAQIDRAAMLAHEKELFTEITQMLEVMRRRRLDAPPRVIEKPKREDEPEERDEPQEHPDRVEVTFVEPVGKFMGEELEPYGPFDKGDSASLPSSIASILIEKGQVKRS